MMLAAVQPTFANGANNERQNGQNKNVPGVTSEAVDFSQGFLAILFPCPSQQLAQRRGSHRVHQHESQTELTSWRALTLIEPVQRHWHAEVRRKLCRNTYFFGRIDKVYDEV
jgi:hypothetical protein